MKRAYYVLGVGWVTEIIDDLFSTDLGRDNAIVRDKDGWFHVSYLDRYRRDLKYTQALYEIYQALILKEH